MLVRTASFAAVLCFAAVFGLWRWEGAPPVDGSAEAQSPETVAFAEGSDRLLDPTPLSGAVAPKFGPAVSEGSSFRLAFVPPAARAEARGLADRAPAQPAASPTADTVRIAASPPLPMPRPAELSGPEAPESSRMAAGSRRARTAALPPTPADTRSFFDKLFGVQSTPTPGPVLAYAAPESSPRELAPGVKLSPAPTAAEPGTALYDISARVVYMPNGERLEAHSGLGEKLDDPRFVHVRMHGATPPGTYDLTEREKLFHGVRAIRLNPVGGSAAVHGRAGLLAHTYMLGPNGQSNGCVSFRQYDKFLQAYLRGEVKRLVVVAGRGQDGPFGIFNSRIGGAEPRDRNG
ncbi:MAG: tlde1 domain-containing protein [Microvirga sp.]